LCEGIHVARTSEVGPIKVIGAEAHGNQLRVRFASGTRALTEFRRLEQILTQIAGDLTVPTEKVLPAITRLTSELAATRTELERVRSMIAGFEADALVASAESSLKRGEPAGGACVVRRVFAERDVAELRQIAHLIVTRAGCVAMLGTAGSKAQLILARSADVHYDMTLAVRIAAQVLNTQGGGQPSLAETIPVRADEARVEAAIAKAVKWLQAQQ
jgi:alanyl-tRNA synthetase